MWKWLHRYAKPEQSYRLCQQLKPWIGGSALLVLVLGSVWGLAFSPQDYQQGDAVRIMYVHVPTAMLSMALYGAMAMAALIGLVWQVRTADMVLAAMAPVGAMVTAIALITGAAWGKPMWGTWWVWDARLTSELILGFMFIGVSALYQSFDDKQHGAKAAAILALVGVINLPIIHYSVQWWNTLHQGSSFVSLSKPAIAPAMLWPLLINLAGFALLSAYLVMQGLQNEILRREIQRKWVIQWYKDSGYGV